MSNDKLKKNLEMKQILDDLVLGDETIKVETTDDISNVRQENNAALYTDFHKLSANAKEESKKIVESIVKFYLDLDIINKSEYVQYKKKLHADNISRVMFQMETTEYVCIKLLEEIDAGNANLKAFEVYGKISDTMLKIIDVQSNIISKMGEEWKKLRADNEEIKLFSNEVSVEDEGSDDLRIKGSRKLVEIAQKLSEEKGLGKTDYEVCSVDPREAYKESLKQNEEDPENKLDDDLFA